MNYVITFDSTRDLIHTESEGQYAAQHCTDLQSIIIILKIINT